VLTKPPTKPATATKTASSDTPNSLPFGGQIHSTPARGAVAKRLRLVMGSSSEGEIEDREPYSVGSLPIGGEVLGAG